MSSSGQKSVFSHKVILLKVAPGLAKKKEERVKGTSGPEEAAWIQILANLLRGGLKYKYPRGMEKASWAQPTESYSDFLEQEETPSQAKRRKKKRNGKLLRVEAHTGHKRK